VCGRRSEGASRSGSASLVHYPRSILHDRRLIADALRPEMMLSIALRIAAKAGCLPGAPTAPSPFPPISPIPIRSIRICQLQNACIAISPDPEMHLECAERGDQDA
jgi:hypothetical protein